MRNMTRTRRTLTFVMTGLIATSLMSGCGKSNEEGAATTTTTTSSSSSSSSSTTTTTLPPAGSTDCGIVQVFGTSERIVVSRGNVTCDVAKSIAVLYDNGPQKVPAPWQCSTGREGDSWDFVCSTDTEAQQFILRQPTAPLS